MTMVTTYIWYHWIYFLKIIFNIVDDQREGAGYYQFFRYGFASCLMDDGYFDFSPDSTYDNIAWFDEYDLAGQASTDWLGSAIDPPQYSAWQNGVYRRRFQNGMAIVNPKGNGTQTVRIEEGYSRIAGSQDPAVNNGQQVDTVTLKERDGIILVRTEGLTEPTKRPNPPTLTAE